MLTEERQAAILALLEKQQVVKSKELVEQLDASESTVRRDLATLEAEGELIRIHGGAKKKYTIDEEEAMEDKTIKNVHDKRLIAKKAVSTVQDGETIYLDAGSTTYECIEFLAAKKVTVVTNGIPHAVALVEKGVNTILIGGQIKPKTKAVVGATASAQLEQYQFTDAFLGMNGIHSTYGLTTPDVEEAALKKTALQQANQSYVLADASKFDKVHFVRVCELDDAILVTTAGNPWIERLDLDDKTMIWEA